MAWATEGERRALLYLSALALTGVTVRSCRAERVPVVAERDPGALGRQLAAVDSAIDAGGRRGKRRTTKSSVAPAIAPVAVPVVPVVPVLPGPVDPDTADSLTLLSLPRIGPALAGRILADRAANGPFGSLDGLQRVRGIGPAMATALAPRLTFSGVARAPPPPRSRRRA
ncbi:MAG: helix-hairpin-helix domain-containing protein [Gemmatimonadaceae bacterium]|nr:helix-hairpin-helix domain-containing protein [Gemmatimonadaceae bacterium]